MTLLRSIATVVLFLSIAATSLLAQSNFEKAEAFVQDEDYVQAVDYIRPAIHEDPNDIKVLALATDIYMELESLDSAKMYGARLYDLDDENSEYVRLYALALTRGDEAHKASRILRRLIDEEPEVTTSLYLVNALLEADSLQAAELVATTAKREYENSEDAFLSLGLLYFKYKPQPVYSLAIQNFERAVDLNKDMVLAHFGLAECYWKMANRESDDDLAGELFKRSLQEWAEVGRLDPKNARAWFEQGKIFYLAKKYRRSVEALNTYRELRPVGTGNPIASWYLGKSYFELKKCDDAKTHLMVAAESFDSLKSEAMLMVARCAFLSRDWPGAALGYKSAVESGHHSKKWDTKDVWYFGASLVLTGDTSTAIVVMTEAAERDPSQCTFMFRFGILAQKKQLTSLSNRVYRQRLDNCSDSLDARIHMLIGNNFFADSLIDSAISQYKLSLSIDSNNAYVKTRLAETYAASGDESTARAMYGEVIANGERPGASKGDIQSAVSAILKLSALDIGTKDWRSIIERCKRGLEIDESNVYLMLYTGVGYQGQGEVDNACKWYKKVLKVDPKNGSAKRNLSALGC